MPRCMVRASPVESSVNRNCARRPICAGLHGGRQAAPDSFNFGELWHALGRIELAAWRQVPGVSMDHSRCVVQIRENRFFMSVSAIAA